jgi:hypothetical protein
MKINTETPIDHHVRTLYPDGIMPEFSERQKRPKMKTLPCPAPPPYETPEELIVRLLDGPTPGALADPQAVLAALRQSADRITQ